MCVLLLESEVIKGTIENDDELIVLASMVNKEVVPELSALDTDMDKAMVEVANGQA